MYLSKSMTFPTPYIGRSRHGLFFTRLDCQSNVKLSEKDHDLPGIQTRDLWSSSQHTQPLHHWGCFIYIQIGKFPVHNGLVWMKTARNLVEITSSNILVREFEVKISTFLSWIHFQLKRFEIEKKLVYF
jgi:hypothetical protein